MKPFSRHWFEGVLLSALLPLLVWGCPAPAFVPEGEFNRPLKEFRKLECRVLSMESARIEAPADGPAQAKAFARDYRQEVNYKLHRRKILDAADGPLLVVEGQLLRYECRVTSEASESTAQRLTATIEVRFTFKDEAGARLGGGTVTAVESELNPRAALEKAEAQIVASLAKFIRKAIGRKAEPESEPSAPAVTP
jgi:hypothetical protein